MSKDARQRDLELTAEEKAKFDEVVAMLARRGFGEEGPPLETTFAQIEQFGHQAGQMVARALDTRLAEKHAGHFSSEQACPSCDRPLSPNDDPHVLPLQTADGDVVLHEPAFRCPQCERDFFPATHSAAD